MKGLVVKALSGFYYVSAENEVFECRARGRFRANGESVLVGDLVEFSVSESLGAVDSVYDRKNMLLRPPIANIDKLFIVSSSVTPSVNCLLIDRLIAICEYKNITPIIVFNKCDVSSVSEYSEKYKNIGYKSIKCSAVDKIGVDEITAELSNSVSAFTGNSGVGKSSLLNVIFPNLNLSTGDVSSKLGRGRHTTRYTELFKHQYDGYVADTPGFSSLENNFCDLDFKDALSECFVEFGKYSDKCKFSDCKHIGEKGCAVGHAVNCGEIDRERYNSYITIYNELKDINPWSMKKEGK